MSTFRLAIYTPEGTMFNGPVESMTAPGREGRFGVLPHHASMIASLKRRILKAQTERKPVLLLTGEGVLEVSDGDVTVLADSASVAEDTVNADDLLK